MTGYAGYLQGLPVAYIMAATAIVFAMMATGLIRFDEWRMRRTPVHKLGFEHALVVFGYVRDHAGTVSQLHRGQIVLLFQNMANFPISYVIDSLECSIDGMTNPDAQVIRAGSIAPLSQFHYRTDNIDLKDMAPKARIEARVKFSIRYGREGRERTSIDRHLKIICQLNQERTLYSEQVPHDVPEGPA